MRGSTLIAVALAAVTASGAASAADGGRPLPSVKGFYAGGGYDYTQVSGASFSGGDVLLGYRFNRRFALEVGAIVAPYAGVTITSTYAEAQYSFGVWKDTRMFLAAGGSYASVSASSGGFTAIVSQGGGRFGLGFDTKLTDTLTWRSAVHYQNALDNAVILHFGLQLRL